MSAKIKTDYPDLLNSLDTMADMMELRRFRDILRRAESTIVALEKEKYKLKAKLAEKGKE